jgi:hypothetical protein
VIRRRLSRSEQDAPIEQVREPAEEAPLFNLDEIYERRILSWSPEPEDDGEAVPDADEALSRDPSGDPKAASPAPEVRAPVVQTLTRPAPVRPVPPVSEPDAETAPDEHAPRRRGRPRGRPRRQVHFHVDADQERLLMKAVEIFGSQQKALIAALESLEENELLQEEIKRLEAESERQRALLLKAESLFTGN